MSMTMTLFRTKVRTLTMTMLGMEVGMRSTATISRADRIADRLVGKLGAPECRSFFCKCAYRLSENEIELLLENATKPSIKSPKHYFTRTASILMSKHYG